VALVFADSVAWPYAEDVTAEFVYLRLHGSEELYASGYSDEALDHFASRIKLWAEGLEPNDAHRAAPDAEPVTQTPRDVYAYFDNDAKVRAPADAFPIRPGKSGKKIRIRVQNRASSWSKNIHNQLLMNHFPVARNREFIAAKPGTKTPNREITGYC